MLGLVKTALLKPYTFIVLAIFICIIGPMAALRTPTDVFPDIGIPVVAVVWQYNGLSPDAMAGRVIYTYERTLSTTVNDIEHIESQSLPGMGIVKIFFQPGVDIRTANAQVTAVSQTVLKQMPPGITPPLILNYSASTVPILQMAFSSPSLSEAKIRDLVQNNIRLPLSALPGLAMPTPMGGKQRQITLDLDPQALAAKGLSAQDVGNALALQNQIIPVGTAKLGPNEYTILLNNSPKAIDELNDLPIKTVDGAIITIGQVAHVRDGSPPQTNIVRVDGHRAVLMPALKNGSISTLSIIDGIRQMLPRINETLPPSLKTSLLGDASVFVKQSVGSVAQEGIIAALLTSAMILLFLGSWRSTLIIAVSIPLAVLAAIALLAVSGQTLNVMTLGGLALAVGILVDDATVTIENINWHLEQGKQVDESILDGAAQIVTPAFVSLLCICIVFVPMFFLDGVARFLFVPMAEAVIFAMVSSFILSRTLVPTMAKYLLKPHVQHDVGSAAPSSNPLVRFQKGFERAFESVRSRYRTMLEFALTNRNWFVTGFFAFTLVSFGLVPLLGRNFFPAVDAGQILLHVRAPVGMRVEKTSEVFANVETQVRNIIPPTELGTVVDNIGLSISGINTAYNNTGTIGSQDGDIQISLKEGHRPTDEYVREMREKLPRAFPGVTFSFPPADIISQILNFGAPAPIDLQIRGPDLDADFAYAELLLRELRQIPGVVDARIQQSQANPQFNIDVNRTQAQLVGITER